MVPLASVLDVEWRTGSDRVVRYNMYPAAEVQGDAAPGYSSGEAMAAIERIAAEVLPPGMEDRVDRSRLSRTTGRQHDDFYLSAVRVVRVPCALGRVRKLDSCRWRLFLIAPICIPFALAGVYFRGMDNNLI